MYSKLGVMVHPCNPALGRPGQEAIQGFRVSLRTGCFRVRPCPKKPINTTKEESKFIKTRKKKIYYVSAHKKRYKNTYRSIIHNSPKVETTQMFINCVKCCISTQDSHYVKEDRHKGHILYDCISINIQIRQKHRNKR